MMVLSKFEVYWLPTNPKRLLQKAKEPLLRTPKFKSNLFFFKGLLPTLGIKNKKGEIFRWEYKREELAFNLPPKNFGLVGK